MGESDLPMRSLPGTNSPHATLTKLQFEMTSTESTVTEVKAFRAMLVMYVGDKRGILPPRVREQMDEMDIGWREHVENELQLTRVEKDMIATTQGLDRKAEAIAAWVAFMKMMKDTGNDNLPTEPPTVSKHQLQHEMLIKQVSASQMEAVHLISGMISLDPTEQSRQINNAAAVKAFFFPETPASDEFMEHMEVVIGEILRMQTNGEDVSSAVVEQLVKEHVPAGLY